MSKNSSKIEAGKPIFPDYLINYLNSNEVKTIKHGSQQDSQEFLGWILEELHSELLKSEVDSEMDSEMKTTEDQQWEEVGKKNKTSKVREFKQQDSSISQIFGGKMRSSIKKRSSKPVLSMEPFFTLHLPIDDHVHSIKDSFQLMTTFEDLKEGFTKQLSIEELPNVLILHLERFTFNKETLGVEKISKKIQFYSELHLDDFIVSKTKIPEKDERRDYQLCAVVCHHGNKASGGHYSTYVHHPCDKWIHLDDTNVSVVSLNQVLKQQAYLLIYVQK
jgi:ubiquitin carboxyl-terminal hydrolase 10